MDIKTEYQKLAMSLGDITYKLTLLKAEQSRLLAEVKKLDELAGRLAKDKANHEQSEAQEKDNQGRAEGNNSPA